ncbi:MAG: hypothetical protein CSA81_08760 [Acidobacteria bacterium]|nr:MAG: hypothetical protein CSA81_08760 [Acidobacteriota bacterium]
MVKLFLTMQFLLAPPLTAFCGFQDYKDAGDAQFKFAQVRIPVWVNKPNGNPVYNLKKKHFRVYVDGHETDFSYFSKAFDQKVDILFLIDFSGSMALGGKLEATKMVVKYLIHSMKKGDQWQIVVFADKQVLKILDDSSSESLNEVLDKARAYGKTALYDALLKAPNYFEKREIANKAVFLFTDGHDNNSMFSLEETRLLMRKLSVPLFAVGIMDGFLPAEKQSEEQLDVGTLKSLSTAGGGELFLAKNKNDLLDIGVMLKKKLRAHYVLGFVVERGKGDKRHIIKVSTKKKLHIKHRNSYIGLPP